MRREFICHRCGTANHPSVENCRYCGLQVGWRPGLPATFKFWRWPVSIKDTVGAMSAPLALILLTLFPDSGAALVGIPLLAVSLAFLLWRFLAAPPGRQLRE